jgi:hypothetical protein
VSAAHSGRTLEVRDSSTVIKLPTWTDATSIAVFITSLLAIANTVLTLVQPGFTYPPLVTALVAPVSILIAGGVVIANVIRHSKATVAAISR